MKNVVIFILLIFICYLVIGLKNVNNELKQAQEECLNLRICIEEGIV